MTQPTTPTTPTAFGTSRPVWRAPAARRDRSFPPAPAAAVRAFHIALPGYAPTPLTELPSVAAGLGVARVFVKDESDRFGLPAFKILGASWAVHRLLERRRERGDSGPLRLVTATDGNHGRAVARTARWYGASAHVLVTAEVHPDAVAAIAAEGAEVTTVPGDYDTAVRQAAREAARSGAYLLQDTALPGQDGQAAEIPRWIAEGYSTLFAEIDVQLAAAGAVPAGAGPGLLAVPVGVGSLAQAAVTHHRGRRTTGPRTGPRTALLAVEPLSAACLLAALRAGHPLTVATGPTAMAGLNCGTVSALAWPLLSAGLDAAVAVTEARCAAALRELTALGVTAGPCGAAALAGVRTLTAESRAESTAENAADGGGAVPLLGPDTTVVLLSTEGADANPHLSGTP
ncbi:pyridoxal-phosphate dependent enzyme [Streptomyces yaizuensis]|uniref:Pyridoxal-phosphate dependent enzyme n=1 Tax=Streptomyces yaizuensis TaxID=2989713 RepID=A0ABQ5P3H0_9ACTN|nr:pyridoxal-phosphate dependent enzyme [Streptomyces sp. YSPA8]GLF96998.1 pyridoxal-phosphate dependent enzyme [Streptomyces sp. YSPA8]